MIKFFNFIKKKYQNQILKVAISLLILLFAIYFIKEQQSEVFKIKQTLAKVNLFWFSIGLVIVLFYVAIQGFMYKKCFQSVNENISFSTGIFLFLKRNVVSVIMPAGLITNMLFFNKELEKKHGVSSIKSYSATSIFTLVSMASAVLIVFPVLLIFILFNSNFSHFLIPLSISLVVVTLFIWIIQNIIFKGILYQFILKKWPKAFAVLEVLDNKTLDKNQIVYAFLLSCLIELIGIIHLYISLNALGLNPSIEVSIVGYAVVLFVLMTSPLLRGLGAVEVGLLYTLKYFGLSTLIALSVTLIYRFFEFWSVLILGLFTLIFKKDGIIFQLLAPILLFLLGVVNLLSGLSPALVERLQYLKNIIPYQLIEATNTFVILTGIVLIVTAIMLARGYKNSFYIALFFSIFSFFGHLIKGIDYEEASFALITTFVLIYQRKNYFIKSERIKFLKWEYALILAVSIFTYGIGGFYLLNFRHFNENFTFIKSVEATFKSIALLNTNLNAATSFGRYFLFSLNFLGVFSVLYLLWLLYKTFKPTQISSQSELEKAQEIAKLYGNSSLDYFKLQLEKQFYFFENNTGFIAYKTTKRYAVVLENPVSAPMLQFDFLEQLKAFEKEMHLKNLQTIYHRIPEFSVNNYEELGKKKLLIGEEAYVNIENFSIEGGEMKTVRNAVNKLKKSGYIFKVNNPPQTDGFLQQLAFVSNSWLQENKKGEGGFSQGFFDETILKNQIILTVENSERKILAFLNIIPSNVQGEINFDLMRKTQDAPNGTMDFMFTSLILHYKQLNYKTLNFGLVPLSGIDEPENLPEQAMQLAYKKIKQFNQYKRLRFFKEKFNPYWIKSYVVYNSELDLVNLPAILKKVMKNI